MKKIIGKKKKILKASRSQIIKSQITQEALSSSLSCLIRNQPT